MAPSSSSSSSSSSASILRREVDDLTLVALGAIPGALLRWQLQLLSPAATTATDLAAATLAANLLGSLLLGVILGLGQRRPRLMLCGGIGFCGSLTTFSAWILQLYLAIHSGSVFKALAVLLASLAGGLALVCLGYAMGRLGQGRRIR